MKVNVEMIHFHIKGWGAQGLVIMQITLEKKITNFYFKNAKLETFPQAFLCSLVFDKNVFLSNYQRLLSLITRRIFTKLFLFLKVQQKERLG